MTAVASDYSYLGIGVYTFAEAASYARMSPATLSRWLGMSPQHERVLRPEIPNTGDRFVTFLDFIQALSVRNIRQNLDISLQKVRDAVNKAIDRYGVQYPLAHKHQTYAFRKDLYIQIEGQSKEMEIVQVSGHARDQLAFRPIVELYMKDVVEWSADGLVSAYRAFQWSGHDIVMNPRRRFGEPIVLSCGYTAQALFDAATSEGSFEGAAAVYGVHPDEVETAYRYFDYLGNKVAA